MFKKTQVNEKYLNASKEHTQVFDYLDTFKFYLKRGNTDFTVKDVKKTLTRFEKDIKDHFRLEEEVLFPAALVCMPSLEVIDQILALQKEHGYFEKDLETLIILAGALFVGRKGSTGPFSGIAIGDCDGGQMKYLSGKGGPAKPPQGHAG